MQPPDLSRSDTTSAFSHLFVNAWLWGAVALAQLLQVAVVHVGLPPTTAVNAMLQRVALCGGGLIQYRVIVSSFDAAYRAVAAGLGISVLPRQLAPYYASAGLLSIPLSDAWAKRRFAICFRDLTSMPAPARRLVEHLAGQQRISPEGFH